MRITRYDSFEKINKILTKAGLEPVEHKEQGTWVGNKWKTGFSGWWENSSTHKLIYVSSISMGTYVSIAPVEKVGDRDKADNHGLYTSDSKILTELAIQYTK